MMESGFKITKRLRQTSITETFTSAKKFISLECSATGQPDMNEAPELSKETRDSTPMEIVVDESSASPKNEAQKLMEASSSSSEENDSSQTLFSDDALNSQEEENRCSLGVPVNELRRKPACFIDIPTLNVHDSSHTILFHPHFRPHEAPRPFPDHYRDKWDNDHVRMPCSPENLYPVDDLNGTKRLEKRWNIIKKALQRKMTSSLDIEEAIMTYNTHYNRKWNFKGLHSFFTKILDAGEREFIFSTILPAMVHLALELPNICTQPIPLLRRQRTHTLTLSQKQIACLLANAFFCTFPRRNTRRRQSEYSSFPDINFNCLFFGINSRIAEKLKCLFHYFQRIIEKEPDGSVTFHRQCMKDFPEWQNVDTKLHGLHITSEGTIEDNGNGMLQVDFANKFLGGGVLRRGCVQEEIRFIICPELIISRLFTEMMDPNECVVLSGCEQYSSYVGYADNFKWAGNYIDNTPRDAWNRRYTEIVAIDAVKFRTLRDQYQPCWLKRELNKAYCGFHSPGAQADHLSAIATGNWGCGAFRGDPHLKSLLQLMAAAVAGRDMLYCSFQNAQLCKDIHKMYSFLKEKNSTVGDIWNLLLKYHSSFPAGKKSKYGLYEFIYRVYDAYESSTDSETERKEKVLERKQKAQQSQDFLDDDKEADALLFKFYESTAKV